MEENKPLIGRYYEAFDFMRVLLLGAVILGMFGLPTENLYKFTPLLNFGPVALFTIYGYLVLRDGRDLKENIIRAAKAWALCFVIYAALTLGYMMYYDIPLASLASKRCVFELVVLNRWPITFCNSIWMLQSALYSLIIIYIFRGLKKLDWLFCIVLMVFGIMVGELAGVINFSFLGYDYIMSNCLTRTIPYMLLGRIIHRNMKAISRWHDFTYVMIFIIGFVMASVEYFGLDMLGLLRYKSHFAGFILMSAMLCVYCATRPHLWSEKRRDLVSPLAYKIMYYIYNPLGFAIMLALDYPGLEAIREYKSFIILAVVIVVSFILAMAMRGILREERKRDFYI